MGGGGKGGGGASAAAGTQADIARQLFAETGPLRNLLFGTPGTASSTVPGTGGSPLNPAFLALLPNAGTPGQVIPGTPGTPGLLSQLLTQPSGVFPAERDTLESQFGRARENVLSSAPVRGGQLGSTLANLEFQRALGVTGLESMGQQRQQENIFRTLGGITGQTQVGLGGLSSAGNIFAQQQQSQLGLASSLGLGAGLAAGSAKGGKAAAPAAASFGLACWIARAMYGRRSVEAALARMWIFEQWQGPVATVCRFLYRRYGRQLARQPLALWFLRPWFDLAVQKAGS